ncbi:MAG: ATP-binding cassette domain-containing protein [Gemmatimonadales bacterium]
MPLLELKGVTKRYPGVVALDSIDLSVEPGSVHCLIGENGAGKSTLLRVIAGATQPDSGSVSLDGAVIKLRSPRDALARGITVIYQELALVPQLGAGANIFLGMERTRGPLLDRRRMHAVAGEALQALGFSKDPAIPVGS